MDKIFQHEACCPALVIEMMARPEQRYEQPEFARGLVADPNADHLWSEGVRK